MGEPLFLRPEVRLEPLVSSFYAWAHTVAPATAAAHLAFSQLPLLDSYLEAPDVHAEAAADPRMRGGPVVDIEPSRADQVRRLRDDMARRGAPLLELAEAVRALHELVDREATGGSLAPLYAQVPQALRGLVELGYDLGHRPVVRFLEPALYRSRYYDESLQAVDLSAGRSDERPFVLTTPRLPQPGHVQLPLPLRHPGLDRLMETRTSPLSWVGIRDALEVDVDGDGEGALRSLFTPEAPAAAAASTASRGRWERRVRYFGHACLVFETAGASVITDPFVSPAVASDRLTYLDLPERLDFCLITHAHQDHVVLETLLHLRHRIGTVVVPESSAGSLQDPSLRLCLEQLGFRVVEVSAFDEIPFPGGRIHACPFVGEHGDLDIRSKTTYALRLGDELYYVGADSSGLVPEIYAMVRQELGAFTAAFVGMESVGAPLDWLYGPLFPRPVTREVRMSRRLAASDAEQAWTIVEQLGARQAYVYAMGEEPWLQHVVATNYTDDSPQVQQVEAFERRCKDRGVACRHLVGTTDLDC